MQHSNLTAILYWLFGGLLLFCCVVSMNGYDVYWHLRNGLNLLELGQVPNIDVLSFTHYQKTASVYCWLFSIFLALGQKLLGQVEILFPLYKFLCLLALLILVWIYNTKQKTIPFVFVLAVLPLTVFLPGFNARPEVISFPLNYGLLIILSQRKDITYKFGLGIGVFLCLWVNWHLSAITGFLTIGAFYIYHVWLAYRNGKNVGKVFAIGLATFFVPMLNPEFVHILQIASGFDVKQWANIIQEIQPYVFSSASIYVNVVLALAVFAAGAAVWTRQFALLLLLVVFSFQTILLEKFAPHLAVLVSFTLSCCNDAFARLFQNKKLYTISRVTIGGMCLLVGLEAISTLRHHKSNIFIGKKFYSHLPQKLDQYIQERNISGNTLNPYEAGGYITYKYWPNIKVAIDGRSNALYDYDFTLRMIDAEFRPDSFNEVFSSLNPDYVIGDTLLPHQLIDWGVQSGKFSFEFVSADFALLSTKKVKYQTSTPLFIHPECLVNVDHQSIQEELTLAKSELPSDSQLLNFLNFAAGYLDATDRKSFVQEAGSSLDAEQLWTNRAIAAMAIKNGMMDLGFSVYEKFWPLLRSGEIFFMLKYICAPGQCETARDLFFQFKKSGISETQIESFKKFRSWVMAAQGDADSQARFDREAKGVRIRAANLVDDGGCF